MNQIVLSGKVPSDDMHDVVVIGAGQAGLATAYYLKQHGIDPLILEAAPEIGSVWRGRYDSLKLFTPSQYSNLPGLAFPAKPDHYPTKDEVADYLVSYAQHFGFDVRYDCAVDRLYKEQEHFALRSRCGVFRARIVIIATGALQDPIIPDFAANLNKSVYQCHSSGYRNIEQLPDGDVLVVGAGNSGAQIAEELAKTGRNVSVSLEQWPRSLPQRLLGKDIFWWLLKAGLISTKPAGITGSTATTPIPTIGTNLRKLCREGLIKQVPRVAGANHKQISFVDGSNATPDAIIWATGFRNDFSWIDIEGVTESGAPLHQRGISPIDGLHFIGLPFLYSKGSAFLGFVADDARHVATAAACHLDHICDIGRPNLSTVLLARHDHRQHLLDQISVEGFRLLKRR